MIIEKGKYYIQIKNGYVTDAVQFDPKLSDYNLYETPSIPKDILNQCYQLVDGELVLDEDKHKIFLEEIEKARLESVKEEV